MRPLGGAPSQSPRDCDDRRPYEALARPSRSPAIQPDQSGLRRRAVRFPQLIESGLETSRQLVSGADGSVTFDVPIGIYQFCESVQAGWSNTFPGAGCYYWRLSAGNFSADIINAQTGTPTPAPTVTAVPATATSIPATPAPATPTATRTSTPVATIAATATPLPTVTRTPLPTSTPVRSLFLRIYTDGSLDTGWADWSFDTKVNFASDVPHAGNYSMAVKYKKAFAGLSFRYVTPIATTSSMAVVFWVRGTASGNQSLRLYTQLSENGAASVSVPFVAQPNVWTLVTVSRAQLGNPSTIQRITIQDASGAVQPTFYVDGMQLSQ